MLLRALFCGVVIFALLPAISALGAVQESLSAGNYHNVVLRSDGTVWAWGNNSSGQLGDGTYNHSSVPVQVSTATGMTNVVKVESGSNHCLALDSSGQVWAWGVNSAGQLGNISTTSSNLPVKVAAVSGSGYLNNATDISAGDVHSLAILSGGSAVAWGRNFNRQLGDGTNTSRDRPVAISTLSSGVLKISAGTAHSAAIVAGGEVKCWGANANGQLGNGTTTLSATPVSTGLTGVSEIFAGKNFTMAVLSSDGSMKAWGSNAYAYLGDNMSASQQNSPVAVLNVSGIVAISAGDQTCFAVDSDGDLWAWGNNQYGVLGMGSATHSYVPVQLGLGDEIAGVCSGAFHSLMVTEEGEFLSCGINNFGQLGDGVTLTRPEPEQVVGMNEMTSLAAGSGHVIALRSDKTVWSWGNGAELAAHESTVNPWIPAPVVNLAGVEEISANGTSFLAKLEGGTVKAWGSNPFGQLGNGTLTNQYTPGEVTGLDDALHVASGSTHSLALLTNGTVEAWGANGSGILGTGTTNPQLIPAPLGGLSDVKAISAGASFSVALDNSGDVWTWGLNTSGQLGNGNTTIRTTPGKLSISENIAAISAGQDYVLAVDVAGYVWVWGNNSAGRLGDGLTGNRTTPYKLLVLEDVKSVHAGWDFSFAVKTDGTVYAWGYNGSGQLGDGSTTTALSPVQVTRLEGVTTLASSSGFAYALKEDGRAMAWGISNSAAMADGVSPFKVVPTSVLGVHRLDSSPSVTLSPASGTIVPLGSVKAIKGVFAGGDNPLNQILFSSRGYFLDEDLHTPFSYLYSPATWGDMEINGIGEDAPGRYSALKSLKIQTPYDHDSDTMPDWIEIKYFGEISATPSGDWDGDGRSNSAELALDLNPSDPDSDGDGIPDGDDDYPGLPEVLTPPSASGLKVWTPLE